MNINILKQKIADQRLKIQDREETIENFIGIEEQFLNSFKPDSEKVVLNEILLRDALRKTKADQKRHRWKRDLQGN